MPISFIVWIHASGYSLACSTRLTSGLTCSSTNSATRSIIICSSLLTAMSKSSVRCLSRCGLSVVLCSGQSLTEVAGPIRLRSVQSGAVPDRVGPPQPDRRLRSGGVEEVVAFVVGGDEGREILDANPPYRIHPEVLHIENLDVGDAVLGQSRCRAAARTEVEAAELSARSLDLRGSVALAEHDHRPAGFLKEAHIAVHPRRSGRPERPRRHVFGSLRRSRVVDGMILDIVGQPLTGAEAVAQFGVDDVA